jgi:predicted DNA-binding protein YlxM (UPF0122 family)
METTKKKHTFIERRAQGYSFDKIAKELKISKVALLEWAKEFEDEITNLKALELEALYEKYYLLKENRINKFGILLNRIWEELETRDLKDIPAEKLLDMFNKFYAVVKEEISELKFKTASEIEEEKNNRELLDELTAPETDYRKLKAI